MESGLLIGQKRIEASLATAVASGRVAHAYLFHGPEGVGKRAAAIAFAAALLCKEKQDGHACRRCNTCQRAFHLGHPDLQMLLPVPNNVKGDEINARVSLLAANPYDVVDFERRPSLESFQVVSNKQVIYSKDRIGVTLRREMSLAPVEGGYRIAILTDAHRMRTEAANAFLKLLEEPGSKTVLILLTHRADRLLPTIRSRCQLLRFPPLDEDAILGALVEREGIHEVEAATLARMADGSYSRALALTSDEELASMRGLVLEFLRTSYVGRGDQVMDMAERLARMGRESLDFFLTLLLGWLRDLLLRQTLGEAAPIVNLDQEEEIRKFCRNLPYAQLAAMVDLVEEAAVLTRRNMNLRLVFAVLPRALQRAMTGEATAKLVVSLSDEAIVV